ncbi:MAG: sulfate adenylyltransferase, partial [Rhodoferax sp.]|nr:sulfate adenylyltransferase [Rhodoferax sp.]
ISALKGDNVVTPARGWCKYDGPSLLEILEQLPVTATESTLPLTFPVQWVEKFSSSNDTSQGRRIFWGRVATGGAQVGQKVSVLPSGQTAVVAQVLRHTRRPGAVGAGHSAGLVLDREVDVSRGDWLLASEPGSFKRSRELTATVAWMDDEPLLAGRVYWALHGHRWVKAKIKRIIHKLDIHTLTETEATQLEANAIGHVELILQEAIVVLPYRQSRVLGSLVLVDTATHKTAGAVLIN